MKKILIITLSIIICAFLPFALQIFIALKDKLPEIVDYKPEYFDFQVNKPLYFRIGNDLYYNADGKIERKKKILSELDKNDQYFGYVSPDSKHILVFGKNYIIILSNSGQLVDTIKPVKSNYEYQEGKFCNENIQWAENSKSLIIAKDEADGKTFLYKYDLETRSFSKLFPISLLDEYFISKDERSIYHRIYDKENDRHKLLKTNVNTLKSLVIDSANFTKELDSIFINYNDLSAGSNYVASGFCDKSVEIIVELEKRNEKSGLYVSKNGTMNYLIQIKDGYNYEKSHPTNINLTGRFLPGDKYYFLNLDTKEKKGSIIIDVKNLKYTEIEEVWGWGPTFSMTSNDCKRMFYINYCLR
jgi:hypothetical protein